MVVEADMDSEWIERAALMDLHTGADDRVRDALDLIGRQIGGVFVSCASRMSSPGVVINRAIGLGSNHPATWEELDGVLSLYNDEGVERFFVQVGAYAQPEELGVWLQSAGLEEARAWQKFARDDAPAPAIQCDLDVRRVGADHARDFGTIVAEAFELGSAGADLLAMLPSRPCWKIFMSFDGDEPVGAGAMFVRDDTAWLDWGATSYNYRERGSQSALLAARIEAARAAGVKRMFTCTGVDVPGDPQHSYANIRRVGFVETEVRANWAPKRP